MPWFSQRFATIDNFCNFCLVFLQWLNKTKNQTPKKQKKSKKQETKKTKQKKQKQKNDKTQLSATTPPLGCAVLFFLGWFLGFLVSYFLVRCWFFLEWLTRPKTKKTKHQNNTKPKKNTKKQNDKTQLSATTPALGVCNIVFFLCFIFCFFVLVFFVSCFLVYVGVILKG